MKTVLGLGSYGVAWAIGVPGFERPAVPLDAFGLLEFADELGLKLVQIADNLPLDQLDSAEQGRLRDEARQRGIMIEVGTRGIAPDHLRGYIDLAAFFGSPILRVVVDSAAHHPEPEEVVSLIRTALPTLAEAGITLAIENHDRFKAGVLAGIIETLDHPNVGICLDTVNSFGALEGPDVVINALGKYVVSLHVKEFVVRRAPHNMGFTVSGAPAGEGMLDIPHLLAALWWHGRDFNAVIETWLPPEARMQRTIELEADWVRQSTAYLRNFIKD